MLKKKMSRLLAVVLCLICMLSACGGTEGAKQTEGDTQSQAQTEKETQAPDETAAPNTEPAADNGVDWEDTAELEVYYFAFGAPKDTKHVEDAINALTEKEINTRIHFNVLDMNTYMQQIGIMMAGGEQIDLMLSSFGPVTYASMLSQNQLMDISEYLDVYGQDIQATVGELIRSTTVGDAVYGVPTYRNLLSTYYIFMRKDVLESMGMLEKAQNMKSMDEYEEILAAVAASEEWGKLEPMVYYEGSALAMLGANLSGSFESTDVYDQLGDQLGVIYCGDDGKVKFAFETESFKASFDKMQDWYEKGYVYEDISLSQPSAADYVKAGVAFSYMSPSEFGAQAVHSVNCGTDMIAVEVASADISAAACTKFTWCVPTTAKEPEAAVAFLNYAMTSPEINNLLAWGVEGVDYEVVDGVAQYIAGNEEPAYHLYDFTVPNQFHVLPWTGDTADMREKSLANMQSGTISPYIGFSCDTTAISNGVAAITTVNDEFQRQIKCGQADDATYEACIEKFYSVGMDKVLAEYQKQLDEYLAAQ